MNNADSLARFRADPSKVRVAVRPRGSSFLLRVENRNQKNASVETIVTDLEEGLTYVLDIAQRYYEIEGIDLGLGGAYEHPFGRAGLEARR